MQRLPEGARGLTLTVAPAAAALPLVVVGVVISWWAWERGGFFDTVFTPGALVLAGLLITLLAAARWPARLTGWARAALLALAGLSAWTLASALWSPTPAVALADAAAPAMLDPGVERRRLSRLALGAVAVSLALASIPSWFSEHYTKEALRSGTDDAAAYEDLDRAASLNPLSDRPLLAEAIVAERAGETQRALAALSEAKDRTPSEWALHYLEARLLQDSDPAGARTALERARRLNPIGEEVRPAAAQSPLDDPSSAQYVSPLPSQDDAESVASESWGVDERIGSLPLTGIDLFLVVGVALLLTGTGLALRRFSAPPDPWS